MNRHKADCLDGHLDAYFLVAIATSNNKLYSREKKRSSFLLL